MRRFTRPFAASFFQAASVRWSTSGPGKGDGQATGLAAVAALREELAGLGTSLSAEEAHALIDRRQQPRKPQSSSPPSDRRGKGHDGRRHDGRKDRFDRRRVLEGHTAAQKAMKKDGPAPASKGAAKPSVTPAKAATDAAADKAQQPPPKTASEPSPTPVSATAVAAAPQKQEQKEEPPSPAASVAATSATPAAPAAPAAPATVAPSAPAAAPTRTPSSPLAEALGDVAALQEQLTAALGHLSELREIDGTDAPTLFGDRVAVAAPSVMSGEQPSPMAVLDDAAPFEPLAEPPADFVPQPPAFMMREENHVAQVTVVARVHAVPCVEGPEADACSFTLSVEQDPVLVGTDTPIDSDTRMDPATRRPAALITVQCDAPTVSRYAQRHLRVGQLVHVMGDLRLDGTAGQASASVYLGQWGSQLSIVCGDDLEVPTAPDGA